MIAVLLLAITLVLSFFFGAGDVPWPDVLSPSHTSDGELWRHILMNIRLPRLLTAAASGAGCAAAGVLSQGLFRNSLASPTVLGTEAGASFAATATLFFLPSLAAYWWALPLACLVGAGGLTILILALSQRLRGSGIEQLLLAGMAIHAVLGALIALLLSLALGDAVRTPAIVGWMLGGFSGRGWEHVAICTAGVLTGLIGARPIAYQLNALAFGDDFAITSTIDATRLKHQVILVISLLVATTVATAGVLPFVGLIVPHITRMRIGADQRRLLWVSALNGASLVTFTDLIARTVVAPQEIQTGVLIALVGAPFFLWLMMHSLRGEIRYAQ